LSGKPGATQTELADLVGIGRAPLGKVIDRLETENWVERQSDPADRRVNRLYITRDFKPIAEPTRTISHEILRELLADVPAADRAVFDRTLRHLHRKLGFSADAGLNPLEGSDLPGGPEARPLPLQKNR
ncbi:MAG: MarR family transcriptional regulator, partial [Proteobacteria bacterium]|nr:MarR family transcriptional regulator [Pseudomonadota bacterium]